MSFTFDEDGYARIINSKPFDWKKFAKRACIVALLVFLGYCAGRVNGMNEANIKAEELMTAYDDVICSYERKIEQFEARERNASILPDIHTWSDIHVPAK